MTEENAQSNVQSLSALLIPFHGAQMVLPENLVVEVLPYAPSLKIENALPWVAGSLLWKTFNVPLINMDRLIFEEEDTASYGRIVIVNALSKEPPLLFMGFLANKIPYPLTLEREHIVPDTQTTEAVKPGLLQYVKVQNRPAVIPDIDTLAAQLRHLIRHHR